MAEKKSPKLPLHKYVATGGKPKSKPKAKVSK